ncbi:hypothetical protein FNH05_14435 [Amycolatopsis rhizosphaerae]|uniref:DUF1579 domain-containing protein n=1 Tax=Amycolatopsis rhizosphaerae TaxID=2053003 RepID=A0A558CS71_9PSEU|nr:hypothetical protein [Amycolatopsis rhizosphaerae]TVT51603.1 hypothetical protein FNH05_14435 [Amycolatopsis rhizosphaerae]
MNEETTEMLRLLEADGPHPESRDELMLYGQFAGSWLVHNRFRDGEVWHEENREWRFGWVLDGRGVQDVLANLDGSGDVLAAAGTTVRVYDPALSAWHVHWFGPVRGIYCTLLGRAAGDEIHQEGMRSDGLSIRWNFTDITPESFRWLGFVAEGDEWRLEQEMHARRR